MPQWLYLAILFGALFIAGVIASIIEGALLTRKMRRGNLRRKPSGFPVILPDDNRQSSNTPKT